MVASRNRKCFGTAVHGLSIVMHRKLNRYYLFIQDSASDFSADVINITNDAVALLLEIDASYSEQAQEAMKEANDVKDALDNALDILKKAEITRYERLSILRSVSGILTISLAGLL